MIRTAVVAVVVMLGCGPAESERTHERDAATVSLTARAAALPPVSEARCREVCEHILALTLAEMGDAPDPAVASELRRAMVEACPVRCVDRATPAGIACGLASTSASSVTACGF